VRCENGVNDGELFTNYQQAQRMAESLGEQGHAEWWIEPKVPLLKGFLSF